MQRINLLVSLHRHWLLYMTSGCNYAQHVATHHILALYTNVYWLGYLPQYSPILAHIPSSQLTPFPPLQGPVVIYDREIIPTGDGGSVSLDWVSRTNEASPNLPSARQSAQSILVILHGKAVGLSINTNTNTPALPVGLSINTNTNTPW